MAEAKQRTDDQPRWNHTFAVLAQLFNAHRDPKKSQAIDLMQFYPWKRARAKAPPPTAADREFLKKTFPGKKRK